MGARKSKYSEDNFVDGRRAFVHKRRGRKGKFFVTYREDREGKGFFMSTNENFGWNVKKLRSLPSSPAEEKTGWDIGDHGKRIKEEGISALEWID